LALTTLLADVVRVIQLRHQIKIYWVHLLWVISLLSLMVQYWFGIWSYQIVWEWNYPKLLLHILAPVMLFIMADLAFPDFEVGRKYDLKDYFYKNRRWFFGAAILYFIFDTLSVSTVLYPGQWFTLDNGFRVLGTAMMFAASQRKDHRSQAILAILGFLALTVFIFIYNTDPLQRLIFGRTASLEVFNYLSVAISVLAGLALTTGLDALSRMIQHRDEIKTYWVHTLWVFTVLMLLIQFWIGFWDYHVTVDWTYPRFVLMLLMALSTLLIASMLVPDFKDKDNLDLRVYFYKSRRWLFGFSAFYLLAALFAKSQFVIQQEISSLNLGFRYFGVILVLSAAMVREHRWQAAIAILTFLLLAVFVAIFNTKPLLLLHI
jgi:hypothetical protein